MKRVIPLLFLALTECKSEKHPMPSDVLPVEKMKMILADMQIADAVAETKALGGANERILSEEYYGRIYQLHHVTPEQFTASMKFYETHPVWLNKLYDEILTELSKRSADVSK
jgi:hypothetical protein